jgi:hypothetical protein
MARQGVITKCPWALWQYEGKDGSVIPEGDGPSFGNPARGRWWTDERDAALVEMHGVKSIQDIANALGTTAGAIRGRVTALGLAKRVYWDESEVEALRELYRQAGRDGVLKLREFAIDIGKDVTNVCRKAKTLGLPTNLNRRIVESRKERRKYATYEEAKEAISKATRARFKAGLHPRGALGMKHTEETKAKISMKSKSAWANKSEADRAAWVDAMTKGQANVNRTWSRGRWKAGWREIGGNKNYYRSRWEANYARYLQWLKDRGEISAWAHEPETFWFEKIKRGVRSYKPDFRVWENDGTSRLHEVKGWMDSRSKTCLSRMAKYHKDQVIVLIDGKAYRAIRAAVMPMIPDWEDSKRDGHE